MRIAKEEIFGPCQQILKFSTLDEVIDRANATEYGLAAGILTKSLTNALHFVNNVRAGSVWVNNYFAGGPQMPFGGRYIIFFKCFLFINSNFKILVLFNIEIGYFLLFV